MRPRRLAAEYEIDMIDERAPYRGFNEAAAISRGIPGLRGPQPAAVAGASMRPRRLAAEYRTRQIKDDEWQKGFNEAAAISRGILVGTLITPP